MQDLVYVCTTKVEIPGSLHEKKNTSTDTNINCNLKEDMQAK